MAASVLKPRNHETSQPRNLATTKPRDHETSQPLRVVFRGERQQVFARERVLAAAELTRDFGALL